MFCFGKMCPNFGALCIFSCPWWKTRGVFLGLTNVFYNIVQWEIVWWWLEETPIEAGGCVACWSDPTQFCTSRLWPWPLACLHILPLSLGKKREMYEHPVFCLASQVMDLTIREYFPHSQHLCTPPTHLCTCCSPVCTLTAPSVLACKVCLWSFFLVLLKPPVLVRLRLECIFTLLVCNSSSVFKITVHPQPAVIQVLWMSVGWADRRNVLFYNEHVPVEMEPPLKALVLQMARLSTLI